VCRYSLFGGGSISNLLLSTSLVSLKSSGFSELEESAALLHVSGDGHEFGLGSGSNDSSVTVSLRAVLGSGGVGGIVDLSLLGLGLTAGEEDQFLLVHVKSIHVPSELLSGSVGSAVIDRDSNGTGKSGSELGSGEFSKGEATTVSDLTGVLACLGRNNGAESLRRTGVVLGGVSVSTLTSSKLLSGLVKVSVGSSLPVLAEMDVGNRVVVLDHCNLYIQ